jgi:hypothetical protein
MAEAAGLASAIISFLTVSVQLSKVLYSIWDDCVEAPDAIVRIKDRVEDLEFILRRVREEEQRLDSNSEIAVFWAKRQGQLKKDAEEFKEYCDTLGREMEKGGMWKKKIRAKWVIKDKRRAGEFEKKVGDHLEMLRMLLDFLVQ